MENNELNEFLNKLSPELSEDEAKELQRTEEWHKQRLGRFTGSKFGDLMTCKSRAKGKDWTQKKWLFDFGDTAITYIIERAIERVTGERIQTPTTWEMQWGIDHEQEGKEYYMNKYNINIEECPFILIYPFAGASPDGKFGDTTFMNFELKCPAKVQNHYKLATTTVAEGHQYFWQIQGEMLAQKLNQTMFVTYDPRFPEPFTCKSQIVNISPIHIEAFKTRLVVAELICRELERNLFKDVHAILQDIADNKFPDDYEGIISAREEILLTLV